MKKVGKFIYWTPRILSIFLLLFLFLFSFDVFEEGSSFWQILGLFLLHNIPVFVLAILLRISWKKEIVGGITFISAGILYLFLVLFKALTEKIDVSKSQLENLGIALSWSLIIAVPAFFIGILFLINWYRKKTT